MKWLIWLSAIVLGVILLGILMLPWIFEYLAGQISN
jgi:hypothetical protein